MTTTPDPGSPRPANRGGLLAWRKYLSRNPLVPPPMSVRTLWLLLPVTLAIVGVEAWVLFHWPQFLKLVDFFSSLGMVPYMFFVFSVVAPLALWPLLIHGRLLSNAKEYQRRLARPFYCPSCGFVSGVGEDELCPQCAAKTQFHSSYATAPIPPLVRRSFWFHFVPLGLFALYLCQSTYPVNGSSFATPLMGLWVIGTLVFWVYELRRLKRLRARIALCECRMCTNCGYELVRSSPAGTCPECGSPYVLYEAVLSWKQWRDNAFRRGSGPTLAEMNRYQILVIVTALLVALLVPTYASAIRAMNTANTVMDNLIAASASLDSAYANADPEMRQRLAHRVRNAANDAQEAVLKASEAAKHQTLLLYLLGLPVICGVIAAIGLWRKRRGSKSPARNG